MIARRNTGVADQVIAFLNCLPIVDGKARGQKFTVDPWMEAWIRDIYEPETAQGDRVVRTAVMSCARKNAKSYLVTGLLLAHLCGPVSVPNGQIFSAACDKEQAAVIFNMAKKMIIMSPELDAVLKVQNSTKVISVKGNHLRSSGSVYKALSADSDTKHGLGPSFFVYDEFGEASVKDDLFNTLIDGQQLAVNPLAVVISTQTPVLNHPLSQLIDDGLAGHDETLVVHLHAADEGCDVTDPEQWAKANPALATWKSAMPIEVKAKEAARLPSKEANFRRRYLNQRVNINGALITRPDWLACLPGGKLPAPTFQRKDSFEFEPGERLYGGLDMSLHTDLTALVVTSAENGSRTKSWFFKPSELIEEHSRRDHLAYDVMVRQGWLTATTGRLVDPSFVMKVIEQLHRDHGFVGLAYDPAFTGPLLKQMDEAGLIAQEGKGSGVPLRKWSQGYIAMGQAINALERAVLEGELRDDGNPLMTSSISWAIVRPDPHGNRKFFKNLSTQRMDGAVALAMALGLKAEDTAKEIEPYNALDFGFQAF